LGFLGLLVALALHLFDLGVLLLLLDGGLDGAQLEELLLIVRLYSLGVSALRLR